MKFYTPLRYPGGKGKLSYYIKSIIEANDMEDGQYVEPYAGGAGVAIELLMEEYVRKIHINDIDPAVYKFWYSVLHLTDELCRRIHDIEVNIDTWHDQKEILARAEEEDIIDVGFATFFLNRTNRSGILKAGVIGGKQQAGKWKMDVRYNRKNLIHRIHEIAYYNDRIHLYHRDAIAFIQYISKKALPKTLVYLDPPYYVKGQALYRNFYGHDDHVQVMNTLSQSDISHWIVSYDNTEQVKDIYKKYRQITYSLQYTAQQKRVGGEVMIFSDQVKIPQIPLGK